MKKYNLLFLAFLFTIFTVNGQLLSTKRVKKSAENKTQQRIDNKADEGIDKGLDEVEDFLFGKKKKKEKEEIEEIYPETAQEFNDSLYQDAYNNSDEKTDQEPDMSMLFGGGGTVTVAESFEFNSSIDIVVTTTDKKGNVNKMFMAMLFPDNQEYFGMEMKGGDDPNQEIPPMKMIYDFKNQQMITMMINGAQKIGMVISLDEELLEKWAESDDNDIEEMPEWKKTGKTKEILGYECEQYVFSNEDGNGEAWVADEDDLNIGYAMNAMANTQKKNDKVDNEYPDGAILEMTFNGDDGEIMTWKSIDIVTDTNISLKTEGYQFMAIGGGK
jgi:CRISPR/Cas system CSM-associated protein Csm5 (group 7 of RAMP superfamily)